ncbi:unnamed protein product [Aphanomyces euteiches]|uniref:Uncharacterized protein n=1 Tax=Aphanomyces euteiches TaxID=100861 RepID=A0A6G0X9S7_9STRA|nr:hypothetical protein Ae201684_006928 [Aphanomyces euteiches]KAH9087425.1 hypothetical protein Ae201684P_000834 [Aphanomyces euteiches]KAH9153769.1 hypothetical protein AeRB84_004034 [Aphanomyces euteiches]
MKSVQATWKQLLVKNAPLARSSHDVSVSNGCLYVFGGEHVPRTPIDSTVYVLDLKTDELNWTSLNATCDVPPHRVAHAQAIIGDDLYVFGGRQGIKMDEKPLNDLHRLHLPTLKWERITATAPPSARSFHKMISVRSDLFVFGGCGESGRLNDLHCFHTATNTWEALPTHAGITGRGGPSFAASTDGSNLVVATGFSGQENNDVHVYNVNSKTWRTTIEPGSNAFRARSVCGATTIGKIMVIAGGEVNTSDLGHEGAGDFCNDLVCLDTSTGFLIPSITDGERPLARGWTAMAAVNSTSAVLFGGLSGNDEAPLRLDDTWLLQVEEAQE